LEVASRRVCQHHNDDYDHNIDHCCTHGDNDYHGSQRHHGAAKNDNHNSGESNNDDHYSLDHYYSVQASGAVGTNCLYNDLGVVTNNFDR
jgi:hypothetical protein